VARTADNEWVSMTRLSGNQESEMLGLFMSPFGNKTRMLEKLRTIAIEWGAKVRMRCSSPQETWVAPLKTTISRKVAYPLPALTLTEAECISIMAPALRAALPESGISSSISLVVRHGPTETRLCLNVLVESNGCLAVKPKNTKLMYAEMVRVNTSVVEAQDLLIANGGDPITSLI